MLVVYVVVGFLALHCYSMTPLLNLILTAPDPVALMAATASSWRAPLRSAPSTLSIWSPRRISLVDSARPPGT